MLLRRIRIAFRNMADTIRFMSNAERRAAYLGSAVVSSLATSGLFLSIHTVYCDNMVEHLQMYRMKFGVPVSDHMRGLLQTVLNEFGSEKIITNSSVGLFNFVGNEVYSIGSLRFPTGAYIGIPYNYNFDDISQLRVEDIRLLGQYRTKRTANSPVIKQLFDAMILSESAKKYAIAHQLNFVSSAGYLPAKTSNIFLATFASFLLAPIINRKLGFSSQKNFLPRILCGVMCFITVTLFTGAIIDQLLDEIFDIRALKRTIRTAPTAEYLIGAEEYYRKLINRNRALYELLGEYGPSFHTKDGCTKRLFGLRTQSYETHLMLLDSLKAVKN